MRNASNLVNLDLYGKNTLISASQSLDFWNISTTGLELVEGIRLPTNFYAFATIGGGQGAKCKNFLDPVICHLNLNLITSK